MNTKGTRVLKTTLAALLIAAIAFGAGYFAASGPAKPHLPPTVAGFIWPPPPPLEDFQLTDSAGASFDAARLAEHWTLLFFGYTHCPDICPTTMHTLKQVRERLDGHRPFERRGQVLFVSVDADRDTPEVLRNYTGYFNPEFLAATAPTEALHQLTGQFGVRVMRISGEDPNEYWFDHPASILLIGPDRRLAGVFAPPLDATDIAAQVQAIVDWAESGS